MSRVGVMPVDVPTGVDVKIEDRRVTAKGKFGELSLMLVDEINLAREGNKLIVSPKNETKRARALWGTSRSLLANIVEGVDQGFSVALEIIGVGYRATIDARNWSFSLDTVTRSDIRCLTELRSPASGRPISWSVEQIDKW